MKYYLTTPLLRFSKSLPTCGIYVPAKWNLDAGQEVRLEAWDADETTDDEHYVSNVVVRAANKFGSLRVTVPRTFPFSEGNMITIALTPIYDSGTGSE